MGVLLYFIWIRQRSPCSSNLYVIPVSLCNLSSLYFFFPLFFIILVIILDFSFERDVIQFEGTKHRRQTLLLLSLQFGQSRKKCQSCSQSIQAKLIQTYSNLIDTAEIHRPSENFCKISLRKLTRSFLHECVSIFSPELRVYKCRHLYTCNDFCK